VHTPVFCHKGRCGPDGHLPKPALLSGTRAQSCTSAYAVNLIGQQHSKKADFDIQDRSMVTPLTRSSLTTRPELLTLCRTSRVLYRRFQGERADAPRASRLFCALSCCLRVILGLWWGRESTYLKLSALGSKTLQMALWRVWWKVFKKSTAQNFYMLFVRLFISGDGFAGLAWRIVFKKSTPKFYTLSCCDLLDDQRLCDFLSGCSFVPMAGGMPGCLYRVAISWTISGYAIFCPGVCSCRWPVALKCLQVTMILL